MKVLVATEMGQGQDPNDYFWTREGELVRIDDCPDECCRCTGFSGAETGRACTTALVVERADLDRDALVKIFLQRLVLGGWGENLQDPELREWAEEDVTLLESEIAPFAPGTVVARSHWLGPVVSRMASAA